MKTAEFRCRLYKAELDVFRALAKEHHLSGPEYFRQLIRGEGEERGLWPPLETTSEVTGDEEVEALVALNQSRMVPDPPPVVLAKKSE